MSASEIPTMRIVFCVFILMDLSLVLTSPNANLIQDVSKGGCLIRRAGRLQINFGMCLESELS
jgi:hypothetical protein